MSFLLVHYVLRAAIRDKILIALILTFLGSVSLSIFMGSAAIADNGQFAIVFAGGGLRIIGVLGLILFVVFHIRRSFESKDVELLLSRPISRTQFLFSFAIAFSILAALTGLMEGACISLLSPQHFNAGIALWTASIAAENIIIVNTAFFFAMVLSSATTGAMATLGLYVLSRMMGEILGIIDTGTGVPWLQWLTIIMKGISSIMPRLDLLGQTSWLVYGPDAATGFGFVALQGAVFTALILVAALIDLARRKF